MTDPTREGLLAQTFVALADTLVVGYDVVELLHTLVDRCADILDSVDVGIILANAAGELEVIASTNERSRFVDLMQLSAGEGPCVEAYLTGAVVSVEDVATIEARWPAFWSEARELGYSSIHSVPLRLRTETIGSLNLFRDHPGALGVDDAMAAQALADVATIGILQERSIRETSIAREQLQRALDSRVVIEQAKGVIAHTRSLDMSDAFSLIRSHARANGLLLDDVARGIIDGTVQL